MKNEFNFELKIFNKKKIIKLLFVLKLVKNQQKYIKSKLVVI